MRKRTQRQARRIGLLALAAGAALVLGQQATAAQASNERTVSIWEQAFSSYSGSLDGTPIWGQVGAANQTFHTLIDGTANSTTSDVAVLTIADAATGMSLAWCVSHDIDRGALTLHGLSSATLRATLDCFDGFGAPAGGATLDLVYAASGQVSPTAQREPGWTYQVTQRAATFTGSITYNGVELAIESNEGILEKGTSKTIAPA